MKSALTCIVIDDDDLDRMAIEAEVKGYEKINLLASFGNPIEAIDFLKKQKPDLLFLDIDMPEINGLDLIRAIKELDMLNIIISSHPEFALEGFQLRVFDFILKPVETERFESCMKRVDEFLELKSKAEAYDVLFENEKILFKEGHNLISLNSSEVLYLEAYGDYTKIVTENRSYLTLATLSNFLESLPDGKFIRIHRSYVVSINKVRIVTLKSVHIGINVIPVGKTYARETKRIFN